MDVLGDQFAWIGGLQRGITVLLAAGIPIALIVAWYHGEKGRQGVSGPELLMVAALLVVAGAALAFVREEPAAGAVGPAGGTEATADLSGIESIDVSVSPRSIAVLPLDNHSPAEEHAFFAEAMTEEITTALSKVPELRVPSRNSAAKYPDSGMTIREFAGELGVAYVLEGSVQRIGDRAKITVQLIDARTDQHVWSQTYDRELNDVLDAQVEISRRVADRLAATFTDQEQERILAGSTDDPIAYDLYLRATEGALDLSPHEYARRAVPLLRQAVERDPEFAYGWSSLAGALLMQSMIGQEPALMDSSRLAMDRAIQLAREPSLATGLRAWRAWVYGGDPRQAIVLFREALETDPSNPFLVNGISRAYSAVGELADAVEWARRGARLDPLSPQSWTWLADLYLPLGMDDAGELALQRALELGPDGALAWETAVWMRMVQGRYPEALSAVDSVQVRGATDADGMKGMALLWEADVESAHAVLEQAVASEAGENAFWLLPSAAHTRILHGDIAGGRAMLDRAERVIAQVPMEQWARYASLQVAAARGDASHAADELGRQASEGFRWARAVRRDPIFSSVRSDPAFEAELANLERAVEQQRRQVERSRADEY